MAEEYKKPIITVKLQVVEEIDPGLKLMIQRRQASQWAVASYQFHQNIQTHSNEKFFKSYLTLLVLLHAACRRILIHKR